MRLKLPVVNTETTRYTKAAPHPSAVEALFQCAPFKGTRSVACGLQEHESDQAGEGEASSRRGVVGSTGNGDGRGSRGARLGLNSGRRAGLGGGRLHGLSGSGNRDLGLLGGNRRARGDDRRWGRSRSGGRSGLAGRLDRGGRGLLGGAGSRRSNRRLLGWDGGGSGRLLGRARDDRGSGGLLAGAGSRRGRSRRCRSGGAGGAGLDRRSLRRSLGSRSRARRGGDGLDTRGRALSDSLQRSRALGGSHHLSLGGRSRTISSGRGWALGGR
ncbi:hypothetical protein EDB80DRAFT_712380 [Ilyonectria destructans]|nr:hypothetical protein EDB80DRAFT_712380 [Ilyonectria destructans]